jgi:hypothetical protein
MVVHACDPSTQEAETEGLKLWDQPDLHSDFKANVST